MSRTVRGLFARRLTKCEDVIQSRESIRAGRPASPVDELADLRHAAAVFGLADYANLGGQALRAMGAGPSRPRFFRRQQ